MKRLRNYRILFEDGTTKKFFTQSGARYYLRSLNQQIDIDDIIYGYSGPLPSRSYLSASIQHWVDDKWVSIY